MDVQKKNMKHNKIPLKNFILIRCPSHLQLSNDTNHVSSNLGRTIAGNICLTIPLLLIIMH